jgi:hypothetical protein
VLEKKSAAGTRTLAIALLAGIVLARLAGGMLASSSVTDSAGLVFRTTPGFPSPSILEILRHHAINLGIGFVLLIPIAWIVIRRRRFIELALLAFALGGMLVPHLMVYQYSWDIVKFPSAAAFALTALYVLTIDDALAGRGFPWSWLVRAGRLCLLGSGLLAAVFMIFPLQGEWRLYDVDPFVVDPLIARAIEWWRGHEYTKTDLILAQGNVAQQLAVFGGLSVASFDYDLQTTGVRRDLLDRRQKAADTARQTLDKRSLDELGARWLLFSNEELDNLGPAARQALDDPQRFELAATFPGEIDRRTRHIWRVR